MITLIAAALASGVSCPRAAGAGGGELIERARAGDGQGVVKAIVAGAEIDQRDEYGATALHWAAAGGHADTALRLWMAGASPIVALEADVPSTSGVMRAGDLPLGVAVRAGNRDVAETFLERLNRAQIDLRNHARETALMIAAETGQTEIVGSLVAAGASLDLRGGEPDATALYHAARNGHAATAEQLLGPPIGPFACRGAAPNAGVSPEDGGETPRAVARRHGYHEIVELIFRCGGIPAWLRLLGAVAFGLLVFVPEELFAWGIRLKTESEPRALLPLSALASVVVAVIAYDNPSFLYGFLAGIYNGATQSVSTLLVMLLGGGAFLVRALWSSTRTATDRSQ